MKIKVRTVQNTEHEIEVEGNFTVLQMKQLIEAKNSQMTASRQKLIFAGRILGDSQTVQDVGIKEGERLVVLVSKGAIQQKSSEISQTKNIGNSISAQTTPITTNTGVIPNNCDQNAYESNASALITGTELETTINNIVNMGFERNQVIAAMRAAFNNPDRAVEYLTSGIPLPDIIIQGQGQGQEQPEVSLSQAATTPINPEMSDINQIPTNASGDTVTGALDSLRTNPIFQQLRMVVQQDPRILPELLARVGQTNPEILQLITENQEEFIRLMERTDSDDIGEISGATSVYLTQQEAESVERLQGLGFPRNAALEAFLICEKNEELAANYLIENSADFFEDNNSTNV
ncbi:UV excision repair protein RAD23 [Cryptosporidium andersoni]|uniref:UV excision repair protein RAD23 n=1 Tax=Cryptosporidium andersoni TaxID=117008 RepID=A0A1J4MDM3_9CRYT|nr:UV excision repair protein RAD23 [Cryptosporidium andersoni]